MSIKMDQDELPEYMVVGSVHHGFKTADAPGKTTLLAAGHHPKLRIVKADVTLLAEATTQATAQIELGSDGTDLVTGLDTGTAVATVAGTVVPGLTVPRNDAVVLNVLTSGATVAALFDCQFESVD